MKASKLIDKICDKGWISDMDAKQNRELLMTRSQFEEVFGEKFDADE